jgi:hypothetical protein
MLIDLLCRSLCGESMKTFGGFHRHPGLGCFRQASFTFRSFPSPGPVERESLKSIRVIRKWADYLALLISSGAISTLSARHAQALKLLFDLLKRVLFGHVGTLINGAKT